MSYSKTARKCIVLFLVNKILKGTKQKHFEIKRRLLNSIGYQIGENTKVVGPIHCVHPITIGKNCWIGENFTVHGDGKVLIMKLAIVIEEQAKARYTPFLLEVEYG